MLEPLFTAFSFLEELEYALPVLRIRDTLVRIRIRLSVPLTYGS
jgi:hypothetical protein